MLDLIMHINFYPGHSSTHQFNSHAHLTSNDIKDFIRRTTPLATSCAPTVYENMRETTINYRAL